MKPRHKPSVFIRQTAHVCVCSLTQTNMDELDRLLEELAQNSAQPSNDLLSLGTSEKANTRVALTQSSHSGNASASNAYSVPLDSLEMKSTSSATQELDSIINDLLGPDLQVSYPFPKSSSPPVAHKSQNDKSPDVNKASDHGKATEKNDIDESQQHPSLSKKTSKGVDAIDDLLGSLSSDMEKMGVRTASKGHCGFCGKCIAGKMVTALSQIWHPEHFVCTVCRKEIGIRGFFERDGKPYCEKDYQKLFAPRCAYCRAPITQDILTALDKTWHPEHFFCSECGDVFGPDGFMEREGKPYCPRDFYRLFAPKCSGCGEPVKENYLSAANRTWHPDCFVCADCLKPFTGGGFMELEGRPLCALHYHSRQGTLCGTCREPISGRCITALGRRFHPDHFVCAFCLRQLSQGVFKEEDGKPYCSVCHPKLFL